MSSTSPRPISPKRGVSLRKLFAIFFRKKPGVLRLGVCGNDKTRSYVSSLRIDHNPSLRVPARLDAIPQSRGLVSGRRRATLPGARAEPVREARSAPVLSSNNGGVNGRRFRKSMKTGTTLLTTKRLGHNPPKELTGIKAKDKLSSDKRCVRQLLERRTRAASFGDPTLYKFPIVVQPAAKNLLRPKALVFSFLIQFRQCRSSAQPGQTRT